MPTVKIHAQSEIRAVVIVGRVNYIPIEYHYRAGDGGGGAMIRQSRRLIEPSYPLVLNDRVNLPYHAPLGPCDLPCRGSGPTRRTVSPLKYSTPAGRICSRKVSSNRQVICSSPTDE